MVSALTKQASPWNRLSTLDSQIKPLEIMSQGSGPCLNKIVMKLQALTRQWSKTAAMAFSQSMFLLYTAAKYKPFESNGRITYLYGLARSRGCAVVAQW